MTSFKPSVRAPRHRGGGPAKTGGARVLRPGESALRDILVACVEVHNAGGKHFTHSLPDRKPPTSRRVHTYGRGTPLGEVLSYAETSRTLNVSVDPLDMAAWCTAELMVAYAWEAYDIEVDGGFLFSVCPPGTAPGDGVRWWMSDADR